VKGGGNAIHYDWQSERESQDTRGYRHKEGKRRAIRSEMGMKFSSMTVQHCKREGTSGEELLS